MPRKRLEKLPPDIQKQTELKLLQLAKRIQRKRKKLNISQEKLAETLDIGVSTLKAIEQGKRLPSLTMLFHLSSVLKFRISIGP